MYQKEIIYMSLYNDEVKERCVGYLKSEERQGNFRLELQIKNIQGATAEKCPIRLQGASGWQEAGSLMFQEGNGKWTGSAAEPVLRAEIILSDISIIKGQSKNMSVIEEKERKQQAVAVLGENERELQVVSETEENEHKLQVVSESGKNESKLPVMAGTEEKSNNLQVRTESKEKANKLQVRIELGENELRAQTVPEYGKNGIRSQVRAEEFIQERQSMAENTPLYESKWEQLLATYEQIHPYGDNRVYVKLEPKDFVILPSGYQHLVNNSFLLHGFYNYRYLILGKEKDFYLGVPGVFYEREKMVALMFGFEAFECEGGNAKEGKFGYYLRKVEL